MYDGQPALFYDTAHTFEEVRDLILLDMADQGYGLTLVSGPITTGGFGNRQDNLAHFSKCIELHRRLGHRVIDIRPCENIIVRLSHAWRLKYDLDAGSYCWPILQVIYHGIIQSGRVSKGIFMPDWQTSTGSRWERNELEGIGAHIHDLPHNWHTPEYEREILADIAA